MSSSLGLYLEDKALSCFIGTNSEMLVNNKLIIRRIFQLLSI
jgi:hypothetical protein